jgi:hypothetical protein
LQKRYREDDNGKNPDAGELKESANKETLRNEGLEIGQQKDTNSMKTDEKFRDQHWQTSLPQPKA